MPWPNVSFAAHSEIFSSLADAEAYCHQLGIPNTHWIDIDDVLPDCNLDWFAPVRRKGRNTGQVFFGVYEKFDGTNWIEFHMNDVGLKC